MSRRTADAEEFNNEFNNLRDGLLDILTKMNHEISEGNQRYKEHMQKVADMADSMADEVDSKADLLPREGAKEIKQEIADLHTQVDAIYEFFKTEEANLDDYVDMEIRGFLEQKEDVVKDTLKDLAKSAADLEYLSRK